MSIRLIIEEKAGLDRHNEPVTAGIPLPQGLVFEPSQLNLWDTGARRCPLQAQALSHWFDGSIKWALLDFQATVPAQTEAIYRIEADADTQSPVTSPKLSVVETTEHVVVDTGGTTFFLNRWVSKPFDRIIANGADLIALGGSTLLLIDVEGQEHVPSIDDLVIEVAGPLRTTIRARGAFMQKSGSSFFRFIIRLSFHAGSGFVEMKMTLHNPRAARHPSGLWDLGDEGSIYFKDLSMHIPVRQNTEPSIMWTTQPSREGTLHSAGSVQIYQDSSGGENWRSANHVNRFGKVMHTFRGYRVEIGGVLAEEGLRATPTVAVHSEAGGIGSAIDKFWQNFPKAIEVDSKGITLRLFPRQHNDMFELQGGEQKTHTIYLQFCGFPEKQPDLGWVHHRLVPRVTPEWYAESKAVNYLSPLCQDENRDCQELIDTAVAGPNSFFARREMIDEYGWRNFGDIYADHEAVNHAGDMPLVSHYNNQYDVIHGALIQYVRGGDERWFELASDLARHITDIDIYHTDQDRPVYNGGLFWHTDHYRGAGTATHRTYSKENLNEKSTSSYGGGPSNEHNYTTGLLEYYYLTGDEIAREAVLGLADWAFRMDTPSTGFVAWLDRRATGLASSTTDRSYHGPGRGAGNSINALLDAYVLDHDQKYLDKAEELIRRCIHPDDDIRARCLDDPEHRWSYLVFLQVLGKYLDVKIDARQIDFMFCYAQASLLHYAEWMLKHEVPYATVLDKVEIPTETWPAHDIRKSVVFDLAAKHTSEPVRSEFKKKADFFFQACLRDLRSFSTCTLVRPLVILLSNAYVHAYFLLHLKEAAPAKYKKHNFGHAKPFRPQFAELYSLRQQIHRYVCVAAKAVRSIGASVQKQQIPMRVRNG